MQTVGVLTGFDGYEALRKEDPTFILDSIADFRTILAL